MNAPDKIFSLPISATVLEGAINLRMRHTIDGFMEVMEEVDNRIMEIVNTDLIGNEQDKKEIQRLLRVTKRFVKKQMLHLVNKPQYIRAHCVPRPDGN